MDFALTDEQVLLRDTARALLTNECPPAVARATLEGGGAAEIDALWVGHLRDWVALGAGPLVDLCLFLEEMGAVVAPGPFFATTALFLPLLEAIDDPLAAAVIAGEVTGTVAMAGADGVWVPNADPVRTFVPSVGRADHLAFVIGGTDGGAASVALRPRASVQSRPVETLDSTRHVHVVDVPADILDEGPDGRAAVAIEPAALAAVIERATVALAAEMVGTTRWLVQSAVAYAKERIQFDRPIGSFQGLQYTLVDMALEHERASAAVYYAAMAVDADDPDRHRAVHVAKAAAGAAVKRAAKDAMQVHGGVGYTWEHDLHLYLRRGYASEYLLGPASWHHDRLAALLLDA